MISSGTLSVCNQELGAAHLGAARSDHREWLKAFHLKGRQHDRKAKSQ